MKQKFFLGIIVLFSLLFLSACKVPKINVFLLGSNFTEHRLFVLQTDEVSGGVSPKFNKINSYTCIFRHEVSEQGDCTNLDNLEFDNTNGSFTFNPSYEQKGFYFLEIINPLGAGVKITIEVKKKNEPPVISNIEIPESMEENNNYTISFETDDINLDQIVASLVCLSSNCSGLKNLTLNQINKTISFNTDFESVGTYSLELIASDGESTDSEVINFSVLNVNRAPILASIGNKTVAEGAELSFTLAATDPDGNLVAYQCSANCPVGLSVDVESGVVTWTPGYESHGSYDVTFRAIDNGSPSLVDTEEITITINNTNRAPNLSSISNQTVDENIAIVEIDLNDLGDDLDADGDSITYSCEYGLGVGSTVLGGIDCSGLENFNFSSETGIINWTPDYTQSDVYEFSVSGSDGVLSDSESFLITVNNINRSPVLDSIGNQEVDEGYSITTINVGDDGNDFDIDGTALSYTCTYIKTIDEIVSASQNCSLISSITFGTSDGLFDWTPAIGDVGEYEFTITGSDSLLSDSVNFSISVYKSYPLKLVFRTTAPNQTIALPIAEEFTYNYIVDWSDGTPPETITSNELKTHTYASAGDYEVKIIGSFPAIRSYYIFKVGPDFNTAYRDHLVHVSSLGKTGLVSLESAFHACFYLESFTIGDGDTSGVTTLKEMFRYAISLVNVDLTNFDTSNVVDMNMMFFEAGAITSLDVSSFNTEKVLNTSFMFGRLRNLENLDISNFNLPVVEDISRMFSGMYLVKELDVSGINTSKVTSMFELFSDCRELTELDLSHFDTSLVTDFRHMFFGTTKLASIGLSNFDTSAARTFEGMFYLTGLESLDVSNFNTSSARDMSVMFRDNYKLSELILPSTMDTSNVINMAGMFSKLTAISELTLPTTFDTSKVTDMSSMFYDMTALTSLTLSSSFDTTLVTDHQYMFDGIPGSATFYCNSTPVIASHSRTCQPLP